jgi:hypothetical protein
MPWPVLRCRIRTQTGQVQQHQRPSDDAKRCPTIELAVPAAWTRQHEAIRSHLEQ